MNKYIRGENFDFKDTLLLLLLHIIIIIIEMASALLQPINIRERQSSMMENEGGKFWNKAISMMKERRRRRTICK